MNMKSKKTIGLLACLMGFGIMNVNAATLQVGSATTTAGATGEVNVELKDADLSDYSEIRFGFSSSDSSHVTLDFTVENIAGMGYQSLGDNSYKISNPNGFEPDKAIGKITFRTTNDLSAPFKITPINVTFVKKDGTEVAPNTQGVLIREGNIKYDAPKSNVAALESLTVSQGALSPVFSKDVLEYKVQVRDTIQSIRINAQASERGTVTGAGVKSNLQMGENSYDLVVTSEDGSSTSTYKIVIIRGEIAEPSAYLKSLEINNIGAELSPEFDSKNNKYTVTIGEEIDELTFKYETEDPLATVTIEGNEKFEVGDNLVKIIVKSSDTENPTEQVYEITVIKEIPESEDESEDLTIEDTDVKKKTNVWLIVGIVAGILAIAGGVAFVLFKKNKKGKNKNKDDKGKGAPKKKLSLMEDDEVDEDEDNSDTLNEYTEEDTNTLQSTVTLNRTARLAKRNNESVTDILKGELFEDEKTRQFDSHSFREIVDDPQDDDDKTKEFDFRDFE